MKQDYLIALRKLRSHIFINVFTYILLPARFDTEVRKTKYKEMGTNVKSEARKIEILACTEISVPCSFLLTTLANELAEQHSPRVKGD